MGAPELARSRDRPPRPLPGTPPRVPGRLWSAGARLGAVETAIVAADRRDRAELEAITEMALNTVRRRLDQYAAFVDPVLLERYQALATLERYVEALGGPLEIHAVFDDEDVKLA